MEEAEAEASLFMATLTGVGAGDLPVVEEAAGEHRQPWEDGEPPQAMQLLGTVRRHHRGKTEPAGEGLLDLDMALRRTGEMDKAAEEDGVGLDPVAEDGAGAEGGVMAAAASRKGAGGRCSTRYMFRMPLCLGS